MTVPPTVKVVGDDVLNDEPLQEVNINDVAITNMANEAFIKPNLATNLKSYYFSL
jgi:hypothetical protein